MAGPIIGGVFSSFAVTIYEHANFEGRSKTFSVGEQRLLDFSDMNDMTSSIRVPKGLVACVYEHADSGGGYGIFADFLEDCADLSQFDLDNKISYISVFAAEQPSGLIWVRNSLIDGQFVTGHWVRKSAGGQPPTNPVAVVSPPIPPHEPRPGDITYAPRSHNTTIELAAGEERLYRLPPVSKGSVTVKAFHADISLHASRTGESGPVAEARAGAWAPVSAQFGFGVIASDDDGGGGPQSDTSPARNLELELRLGNRTMASHGNLVQAESPNHTDGWRLRIRRLSPLNDLTPNPGRYRIEATYTSQLPILERRIPASFFHEGFEANWNRQQYIQVYLNSSKLFVNFQEDLRQLYGELEETYVKDTGLPLDARDLHASSLRLDVGAGPSPRGGGNAPFFSVRADFPAGGKIGGPLGSSVTLFSFHITARFYLCRSGDELEYIPVVESDLRDILGDIPGGDILGDILAANVKRAIEDGLYELQFPPHSGASTFGHYLAPWLIGDRRQLWSIGYAPGAADTQRADGVVESATGELLLSFVGTRPKPSTEPVLGDPDRPSPPPVDDGSIRLYDVPDEDPDPVPGTGVPETTGGGGAVPRPKIGALAKIDHIVVLMQENRSFDQVLGYLSRELGRTDVNGLNALPPDPNVNPQYNHFNNRFFFPQRAESTSWPSFTTGPCHETDCVLSQMDDNMGRFVASFAERAGVNSPHLRLVMDYFGADQLPVYAVLAREFGICDKWYTSHAGPTIPNRFVLLTGDLNLDPFGNVEENNPDFSTMLPVQTATLFDHLSERGVSWRIFENGYSFIRLFRNFTFDTTNVLPFDDPVRGFEAAAAAGDLPQVTLIEPDYIDLPPGNDDHPPADMKDGQKFVNRIVQALIAGPQWERTLLVITYDEHGGFYDHAPPPTNAPPLRGSRRTLGPRVPTFVVSPLVERGAVFKSRFDHTSIGATILRRFAGLRPPPSISERLDSALDLRETLTLAEPRPRSDFASLGLPALKPSARRSRARSTLRETSERIGLPEGKKEDFHWLLSAMRLLTGEAPR